MTGSTSVIGVSSVTLTALKLVMILMKAVPLHQHYTWAESQNSVGMVYGRSSLLQSGAATEGFNNQRKGWDTSLPSGKKCR
jgi:hypothetical protein